MNACSVISLNIVDHNSRFIHFLWFSRSLVIITFDHHFCRQFLFALMTKQETIRIQIWSITLILLFGMIWNFISKTSQNVKSVVINPNVWDFSWDVKLEKIIFLLIIFSLKWFWRLLLISVIVLSNRCFECFWNWLRILSLS